MTVATLALGDSLIDVECHAGTMSLVGRVFPGATFEPSAGRVDRPVISVSQSDAGDVSIRSGGVLVCERVPAACAELVLLNLATELLAARCRDGLVLHAGCVAWRGGGVLIPGASGAGKTTLTLWLLDGGAERVSDEIVHVDGDGRVTTFPRPVVLKRDGAPMIAPPGTPWAGGATQPLRATGVICPQRSEGSRCRIERLSAGEAALRLMAVLVNARNLEAGGLGRVARLARAVRASRVRYADVSQIRARDLLTCSSSGSPPGPSTQIPRQPCS